MHSTLTDDVRELLLLDKHQILKGNEPGECVVIIDNDPFEYRYLVYMLREPADQRCAILMK